MRRSDPSPLPLNDPYRYQCGLGNHFTSEVVDGLLPRVGNSPQRVSGGYLHAELLSGTPQSVRKSENRFTWMYRRRPSVATHHWVTLSPSTEGLSFLPAMTAEATLRTAAPVLLHPLQGLVMSLCSPSSTSSTSAAAATTPSPPGIDFLSGLSRIGSSGSAELRTGYAVYQYHATADMNSSRQAFCNADGHWMVIPVSGALDVQTELGCLFVQPREILVIPRGVAFSVRRGGSAFIAGYALELWDGAPALPIQGVIGTSGLASPRDFLFPVAFVDDRDDANHSTEEESQEDFVVFHKLMDHVEQRVLRDVVAATTAESSKPPPVARRHRSTVFDVEAWHGNYAPYKYDLGKFCAVNTVAYDHMDPCIGTVLSVFSDAGSGSGSDCMSVLDVIVFVPQPRVAVDTFRPPNFHRNCMVEIIGVIQGGYEARGQLLRPGGLTVHNLMTPHGPLPEVVERELRRESDAVEEPREGNLAFMVEARLPMRLTSKAVRSESYSSSWKPL